MRSHLFKYSYILLFSIGIISCIKKEHFKEVIYDPLQPTIAAPLINSTLNLKDIVGSLDDPGGITEGPDGFYTFFYYDTISSEPIESYVKIPEQNFTRKITAPIAIPGVLPVGDTSLSGSFNGKEILNLNNGSNLEYIDFKSGSLKLNFQSTFKQNLKLTITIPSLVKNNVAYTQIIDLNYNGSSPITSPDILADLSGYKLSLIDGTNLNTMQYSVRYKITSLGNPVTATDDITFSLNIFNPKFKVLFGDLGNIALPDYSGVVKIGVFDNSFKGNVTFEDVKLRLKFANSFGLGINLNVNELETFPKYGPSVKITSPGNIPGPIVINSASTIGGSGITNIEFNKTNSNVVEGIAPAPENLKYAVGGSVVNGQKQFITDQSKLTIFAELEIPIKGKIKELVYADTLKSDKMPNRDIVDSVIVKIKVTNALPLDANVQVYFLDSLNNVLDSLIADPKKFVIPTANFDASGKVTQPVIGTTEIKIGAQRYDNKISKTYNIAFVARTTTPSVNGSQVDIKLYSYNYLKVQISFLAKATIKIE